MAAAACKSLNSLPSSLLIQRSHCGANYPRQQIKCLSYHRHPRSLNISFKLLRHKRENARRVCTRAVPEGDEDWENCSRCNKCDKCNKEICNKCNKCHDCNKKDKEENLKTDEASREEITETKSRESSEQSEPVKRDEEEQQQQSSSGEEKPSPSLGRFHCFARKLGVCDTTTSRDEELKKPELQTGSKLQVGCSKLRYWWRCATRPQNLLAAFLAGLLLYAFALFGWQVMVVAADVTLYVFKCCFVAVVVLFLYILLI